METQPTPKDEEIAGEDLVAFSLEELEELFLAIFATQEKIFHTVSSNAQGAMQIEAQRLAVIELENQFKEGWPYLKAIVEALIYHAIFPEDND